MDLAIVLDTSGSTRNDRFFAIQNFVGDLIELLEVGPTKTQVAALHFSNETQVRASATVFFPGRGIGKIFGS